VDWTGREFSLRPESQVIEVRQSFTWWTACPRADAGSANPGDDGVSGGQVDGGEVDFLQHGVERRGTVGEFVGGSRQYRSISFHMLGRYSFQLPYLPGGLWPLRDADATDEE
jgi:hypothetical protein